MYEIAMWEQRAKVVFAISYNLTAPRLGYSLIRVKFIGKLGEEIVVATLSAILSEYDEENLSHICTKDFSSSWELVK